MNDLKRSHPDRNDNNKDDNNDDNNNNNSNRYSDEREKRRRVQDDSQASTGSSVGAGAVAGARGAGVKGTPGPGSKGGNAAGAGPAAAGSKRMFGALMGHLGRAKKMLKEDSEVIQVLHSLSHLLTRLLTCLLRRVYVWLMFSLITLNHALFSFSHSLTHPRISGASGETTGGATEEQRRE
jgi:hypothetical protein